MVPPLLKEGHVDAADWRAYRRCAQTGADRSARKKRLPPNLLRDPCQGQRMTQALSHVAEDCYVERENA